MDIAHKIIDLGFGIGMGVYICLTFITLGVRFYRTYNSKDKSN